MIHTNENIVNGKRKFGIRDQIGYLFGDLGSEGFFDISAAFLLVFYTDVFGISPALTGSIFLFARLWDAFMDVTAGRFIDRRPTTKDGKYKSWILRFSPIFMIASIIMYVKIPGLSSTGYFVYAAVTYILWGTCYSFAAVPYGSMAAVITDNSTERASLSTFRSMAGNFAQMTTKSLIPLFAFTNNKPDGNKFIFCAIVVAMIGMISYIIFYKFCTERIIVHKPKQRPSLLTSVKVLSKNKPFVSFICVGFFLVTTISVNGSLNAYLYKDYFESTAAMSLTGVILILNIILIAPLVGPISKRFGKKESASGALLFSAIAYFILFLIPTKNPYLFVGLNWIANAGIVFVNFINWAFISDISDYHENIIGTRQDGTVFSLYTFSRKMAQSVAGAAAGIILSAVGYVKAAKQPIEVALNIRNITLLFPVVSLFILFLIMTFVYPLTKEKVTQLRKELEEKRAETEE